MNKIPRPLSKVMDEQKQRSINRDWVRTVEGETFRTRYYKWGWLPTRKFVKSRLVYVMSRGTNKCIHKFHITRNLRL